MRPYGHSLRWGARVGSAFVLAALVIGVALDARAQSSDREVLIGTAGGRRAASEPARPDVPQASRRVPSVAGQEPPSQGDESSAALQLDMARDHLARRETMRGAAILEAIVGRYPQTAAAMEARDILREIGDTSRQQDARTAPAVPAAGPAPVPSGSRAAIEAAPAPTPDLSTQARLDDQFRASVGDRVYFADGSVDLGKRAHDVLALQALWLRGHPQAIAMIEGHADDRGGNEQNSALAMRRAEVVRDRLVWEGVAPAQLQVLGRGRERRVAVCEQPICSAQNRRAVTIIGATDRETRLTRGRPQ